jgi:hypothetical protein
MATGKSDCLGSGASQLAIVLHIATGPTNPGRAYRGVGMLMFLPVVQGGDMAPGWQSAEHKTKVPAGQLVSDEFPKLTLTGFPLASTHTPFSRPMSHSSPSTVSTLPSPQ